MNKLITSNYLIIIILLLTIVAAYTIYVHSRQNTSTTIQQPTTVLLQNKSIVSNTTTCPNTGNMLAYNISNFIPHEIKINFFQSTTREYNYSNQYGTPYCIAGTNCTFTRTPTDSFFLRIPIYQMNGKNYSKYGGVAIQVNPKVENGTVIIEIPNQTVTINRIEYDLVNQSIQYQYNYSMQYVAENGTLTFIPTVQYLKSQFNSSYIYSVNGIIATTPDSYANMIRLVIMSNITPQVYDEPYNMYNKIECLKKTNTTSVVPTTRSTSCWPDNGTIYINQSLSCNNFKIVLSNVTMEINGTGAVPTYLYLAGLRIYYNNTIFNKTYVYVGINNQKKLTESNNSIYLLLTSAFLGSNASSYIDMVLGTNPFLENVPNYTSRSATGSSDTYIWLPSGYSTYICGGTGFNLTGFSWNQNTGVHRRSSIGYNNNGNCKLYSEYNTQASEVGIGVNSTNFINITQSSYQPYQISYSVPESNSLLFIIISGNEYSTYPLEALNGISFNLSFTTAYPICNTVEKTGTSTIRTNGTSQYGTDLFEYSGADIVACTSEYPYTLQVSYPYLYNSSIGIYNFK